MNQDPATTIPKCRRGFINRLDEPVRFIALLGREDDFGVALRQGKAGLPDLVVSPNEFTSERDSVGVESRVEVRDRNRDGVDGLKNWSGADALSLH